MGKRSGNRRHRSAKAVQADACKAPEKPDSESGAPDETTSNDDLDLTRDTSMDPRAPAGRKNSEESSAEELRKNVSYGLMRLQSQRRNRVFAKWLLGLLVVAGIFALAGYLFGDFFPTDLFLDYWDQITQKLGGAVSGQR